MFDNNFHIVYDLFKMHFIQVELHFFINHIPQKISTIDNAIERLKFIYYAYSHFFSR